MFTSERKTIILVSVWIKMKSLWRFVMQYMSSIPLAKLGELSNANVPDSAENLFSGRPASSEACDWIIPTNSKSQIALKYIELSTESMVEMT